MGGFQPWHLLIIAIVGAFLFFGWKNLPDMARSFGRSLRVFKTEIKGMTDDDSAREKAKEATEASSTPKQLEPRPAPVQRAEVVAPRVVAEKATAGARPRPTPSPNGRPRS